MSDERYIRLAERYVSLSNTHRLNRVFSMFAEDATYLSIVIGSFVGLSQIKVMMCAFFIRYPDVIWEVPVYRSIGERKVAFDFVRRATDSVSEKPVRVEGAETIEFTEDGLIRRIEVT